MMEWKNIEINIQNIETYTERATLIKMPNNSDYAGYKFWHPSKLIRRGSNSYSNSIGYTNEFEFKLFKNGNGKQSKYKKIDEFTISVEEFEEAFKCMESCTRAKETDDSYLIIEEPEKIERDIEIVEELKNEEE